MEQNDQKPPNKSSKGYGKHSVWYWILIYIIIAIVVYGIIYLLFLRDSGGNGGGPSY